MEPLVHTLTPPPSLPHILRSPYYREPVPSTLGVPTQLVEPLVRSFKEDHYVEDTGDVVFYKTDPTWK